MDNTSKILDLSTKNKFETSKDMRMQKKGKLP